MDLFGHLRLQFLSSNSISQGHGHCALGFTLTDDVSIQFLHNLSRRHLIQVERAVLEFVFQGLKGGEGSSHDQRVSTVIAEFV